MRIKTKTYAIDEDILQATLRFDEGSRIWLEDFIDFESEPRYTPNGRRWRSVLDVGCPYADPRYQDCGTCPMLKKQSHRDLIGVCYREELRKDMTREAV